MPPIALALKPPSAPDRFQLIFGTIFSIEKINFLEKFSVSALSQPIPNILAMDIKKPPNKKNKIPIFNNFSEFSKLTRV